MSPTHSVTAQTQCWHLGALTRKGSKQLAPVFAHLLNGVDFPRWKGVAMPTLIFLIHSRNDVYPIKDV